MKFRELVSLLLLSSAALFSQHALSAWFLIESQKTIPISDEQYDFRQGRLPCWVGRTTLTRNKDSFIEARWLTCQAPPKTTFSVNVVCNLPQIETNLLAVNDAGKDYGPMLVCANAGFTGFGK